MFDESVLIESRSARDGQMASISHERSQEILNKVKGLYFAVWRGLGLATTGQLAEFYEVDVDAVESRLRKSRIEFESDGLRKLTSSELKAFKELSAWQAESSNSPQLVVWTPRAALRLGFLLQNSEVAKVVRTSTLNAVDSIASAQPPQIQPPALSPAQEVAMVADALIKLGIDPTNPRYSQGLRDWTLNKLGVIPALPPASNERWMGAAERAEELGFGRIGADMSKRVSLGHWLAKHNLNRRREKRYCNGQDREIWCYLVCDELDKSIKGFFGGSALSQK